MAARIGGGGLWRTIIAQFRGALIPHHRRIAKVAPRGVAAIGFDAGEKLPEPAAAFSLKRRHQRRRIRLLDLRHQLGEAFLQLA